MKMFNITDNKIEKNLYEGLTFKQIVRKHNAILKLKGVINDNKKLKLNWIQRHKWNKPQTVGCCGGLQYGDKIYCHVLVQKYNYIIVRIMERKQGKNGKRKLYCTNKVKKINVSSKEDLLEQVCLIIYEKDNKKIALIWRIFHFKQ